MVFPVPKCREWTFHFFFLLGSFLLVQLTTSTTAWAKPQFPIYPCIQQNVRFWEAIYSRYTSRHGVIHDADDLGRIYAVVELAGRDLPWSAWFNENQIQQEKKQIRDILESLAAGTPPQTAKARRINALFPKKSAAIFLKARDSIRLQIGQKDRFMEGVVRSGRYLASFRQTFARHGLPLELAYLPHVESSFNPKAFSKAGAAGLWQFTRGTGSDYLTVTPLVDERYDPYAATDAAARLLKENYKALGSWPLALTAYNYGRAGMLRAVRNHGSYERIFTSYDGDSFKFAARNFYSEFIAATRVAKRLEAVSSLRKDQPDSLKNFRLKKAIPLPQLLAQTGLSREQFVRFNPALSKSVLAGQQPVPKGYLARIPSSHPIGATRIAQNPSTNLAKIKKQPSLSVKPPQKVTYTVQKGDSITSIARKFKISPQIVTAANKQKTILRTGEKLLLPQYR